MPNPLRHLARKKETYPLTRYPLEPSPPSIRGTAHIAHFFSRIHTPRIQLTPRIAHRSSSYPAPACPGSSIHK
ncbi:hypothetical protein EJ06DRAFT_528933 [Trichodelitschia bisporula]|uniref:Uncharacterized protein n=1 Tax=Trichodelitschia bisporula TaxID=703511 RepID=A0A6G1I0Q3_9PEZI|nr:hypothetical protein EJ06DRAFT_528933 [Trichodelitschia bisporula]